LPCTSYSHSLIYESYGLVKYQVETSSHSGSRQKFGQLFIHTGIISKGLGKHYSKLFKKRQKGDYNDFFDFDEETVLSLYQPSVEFIKEIEKQIKGQGNGAQQGACWGRSTVAFFSNG